MEYLKWLLCLVQLGILVSLYGNFCSLHFVLHFVLAGTVLFGFIHPLPRNNKRLYLPGTNSKSHILRYLPSSVCLARLLILLQPFFASGVASNFFTLSWRPGSACYMSARQRPKQQSLLSRLLCCISPWTDDSPSSDLRPAEQASDIEGTSAPKQAPVTEPPATSALSDTEKSSPSSKHTEQTSELRGHNNDSAPLVKQSSEKEAIEGQSDNIPGLAALAPPIERDVEATTLFYSTQFDQSSTEALPEERAALLDDEPLTPASAAMTATDPVADVVDQPSERLGSASEVNEVAWLLPPLDTKLKGKKCLVLDLDETLVHSSFKVRFNCFPKQDNSG